MQSVVISNRTLIPVFFRSFRNSLMIFSLATLTVSSFVEQCGPTEEVPHDHNGDGKPDHDDAGHDHDGEVDTDDNVDTGDDEF